MVQQEDEDHPSEAVRCAICDATRPFILHLIPYRGLQRHICTACVLDSHPGSFCPICFDVFLNNPPPPLLCLLCLKCPSISHISCVPHPHPSSYLCPLCSNPNFTFFHVTPNANNNTIEINLHLAKQLVAAATIAFESINNAAVMARINADIRVQEALLSKAEAKQVLDRLNNLVTSGNGTGENGRHEAKGCSSQPSDADD
ncbi:uncharacterized protein LOC132043123 isoform X1 [Lycium ferocissimum]|uniref:uncharacterized protein LOC132043123 isoform X1 n=1 Tax=Lycium ferocissimum TaxID=112874 RepID=UPI002815B1A5|nr:uncharacterized protein LOC132043123 isoform X1 [Lycium ferocissimum]